MHRHVQYMHLPDIDLCRPLLGCKLISHLFLGCNKTIEILTKTRSWLEICAKSAGHKTFVGVGKNSYGNLINAKM